MLAVHLLAADCRWADNRCQRAAAAVAVAVDLADIAGEPESTASSGEKKFVDLTLQGLGLRYRKDRG